MNNKIYPSSQTPIRRTVELLPSIFRTTTNDKFMSAVIDPLVQPGVLQKLVGYVGRRYGKTYRGSDVYLDSDNTLRSRYQLEPGVVVKDNDGKVVNFYDYLDFKNQLKFFGNNIERDDLITAQEHYSWNPPKHCDKFVNYREYYWVPEGPPAVMVYGAAQGIVSEYSVKLGSGSSSSFVFTPDNATNNPTLTLFRGQTYRFKINAPKNGFSIRRNYDTGSLIYNNVLPYAIGQLAVYGDALWRAKTNMPSLHPAAPSLTNTTDWQFLDVTSSENVLDYDIGVTNNNIENGYLTFTVPNNSPDQLFYQSVTDPNRFGRFIIADIESNTKINIEKEIIGKAQYTSSNGVAFTSGLVVEFGGQVTPEKYAHDTWIIENVGVSISLTKFSDLVVPTITSNVPEVFFDDGGFDTDPYDDASAYAAEKDYIVISRDSPDRNPWSRYNRWFHKEALDYAYRSRGEEFSADETARAKRPIIEFLPGLQLINHGSVTKETVDYVDTYTDDVFSKIEGSIGYNIDGEDLFEGARILVVADTDSLANNRIYQVTFITHNGKKQIHLATTADTESTVGEGVLIRRGVTNKGLMYHFNGTTWLRSQTKTAVNQSPLFDVFDENGISFADVDTYPVSTFIGTNILSYKLGNGRTDTELGIPLSYLNIDNVGDIQFNFEWDTDTFAYTIDNQIFTKKIATGFYRINPEETGNCWIETTLTYIQPIIDSVIMSQATNVITFTSIDWTQITSEDQYTVKFYVNGLLYTGTYERDIDVFTFADTFAVNDVVSLKLVADVEPNTGYYQIPVGLEKNPLNAELSVWTLGQAVDHLNSALDFNKSFKGVVPGNTNLRDIPINEFGLPYNTNGTRYLHHSGLVPLAISLICDKTNNVIRALQYANKSYTRFKNNFLENAAILDYNNNSINFVDDIITHMSKTKTSDTAFADSDMIGAGAYTSINYTVEDEGIKVFSLSTKFNLIELSRRAVYVYVNNVQLLNTRDYEFNSTFGFVTLKISLVLDDVIEIREYLSTATNFIPATPTSMGLYKKYTPMMFLDDTYVEPRMVIQGHDGSITAAFGDYRDDLLLELEYRIYNNIKTEYDENVFDIDSIVGGYYGNGIYTKPQLDDIVSQEFLKWVQNTNINYTVNSYIDTENSFTYTYSNMSDPTRTQTLPGYWRGVYQWFYDTDRPHRCPWEMLGFSEQPTWWEAQYGAAPYTNGNLLLWEDLADGIIRQGDRAGTYDRYKRPTLLKHIPVDGDGILLSPLDAGLANDYTLVNNKGSFALGDVSPVEYAWRSSSEWPFAVMIAMCLLKPFEFIPDSFDRSRTKLNILGQTVHKNTDLFVTLNDLIIPTPEGDMSTGLVKYIVDYAKSLGKSIDEVSSKIKNIDVQLSNRLSGFVNQDQYKYLLDSKSPSSASSSVYVPAENYDIIFNVSTPIASLTYSGVIIEKIDGGWQATGYDDIHPYFEYYESVKSQADPVMTIGGTSEAFTVWIENKQYTNGQLVRYNNDYYRALQTHNSGTVFNKTQWKRLAKLPVRGAVEAARRKVFNKLVVKKMSYGSVFTTIQDVVNFLLGYEARLQEVGFVFNNYDSLNQVSQDWTTSCKEFMFWTRHNWSNGALITLSPAAQKIELTIPVGVADSILDSFYEYQLLKSDGKPLEPRFINVNRGFQTITVEPVNTTDGIYYIRVHYVLKEHVTIFSDRTVFNDVIYDKSTGYRQDRIKAQGYRTTDWDGDYTSPGFLFDNVNIAVWQPFTDYKLGDIVAYRSNYWTSRYNQLGVESFNDSYWSILDSTPEKQLVPNFDYKIKQFEDYYDTTTDGISEEQRALARHAIGYQTRTYLQNLSEDPVTQFQLYQGFIREKGTSNAITKVFDKLSRSTDTSIELNEEWAFRVGQFGGVDQLTEVEMTLAKSEFVINPQPIMITNTSQGVDVDQYYRINQANFTIEPIPFSTNINPTSYDAEPIRTAGYVKTDQIEFVVAARDDILTLDVTQFAENDHVWITFLDGYKWTVLRYNISPVLTVNDVTKTSTGVVITLNRTHDIQIGDIIGITSITNLTGFYKVIAVTAEEITVTVSATASDPVIEDSTLVTLGQFTEVRVGTYAEVDTQTAAILPRGAKLWVDNNGNDQWEVVEKKKQYINSEITTYGTPTPLSTGTKVLYDNIQKQLIASMPELGYVMVYVETTAGLKVKQIIGGFGTEQGGTYGDSMALSPDGKFLAIGTPGASNIASPYRGEFDGTMAEVYGYINANILTVTLVTSGTVRYGMIITGSNIQPGTTITGKLTGDGGLGTYTVDVTQYSAPGTIDGTPHYAIGDIVLSQGQLWKAVNEVFGDGSSINIASQDWTPASVIEADVDGYGAPGVVNQGTVSIYEFIQQEWRLQNIFVSPRPSVAEFFGSEMTIGQNGSEYYMAVSAPGYLSNTGRVYLFNYNGTSWSHLENQNYMGVYVPGAETAYPAGAVVWYDNRLFQALRDITGDGSTLAVEAGVDSSTEWIEIDPASTHNSLPHNVAMEDDGSTTPIGLLGTAQFAEIIKRGDMFGKTMAMNRDGSILAIGAPFSDGQQFANYRGLWNSYQEYLNDDVVKLSTKYYKLITPDTNDPAFDSSQFSSINQNPSIGGAWHEVADVSTDKLGKVFVYQRSTFGSYELIQTLDATTVSGINIGDQFGAAIDIDYSGSTLVVSSPLSDITTDDQGAVYIFRTDSYTPVDYKLTQTLQSFESFASEKFGSSISITANTEKIVVGTADVTISQGYAGAVYVFEIKDGTYFLTEKLEADITAYESFGYSIDATDAVIVVGSPTYKSIDFETNLSTDAGMVRLFRKEENVESWETIGIKQPTVDIKKIKSIELYDDVNDIKIGNIDYVDHAKLKILNIAEQELKFKTLYDPAVYTIGTDNQVVEPTMAWAGQHVGELWWDVSTAKWLHYEQGDISYRTGNWNQLAVGASIDVYEWIESVLLPSEWSALADTNEGTAEGISGQPLYADDTVLTTKILYNESTGLPTATLYYYWVKGKVIVPENMPSRRISAFNVETLIRNPVGTGVTFIALTASDKFLTYNFESILNTDTALLNIQYLKNDKQLNPVHNEYQLLTEGDATSLPTGSLETKWIDSLIGTDNAGNRVPDLNLPAKQKYGLSFRPRQSMFIDRVNVLQSVIIYINSILAKDAFADIIDYTNLNLVDTAPASVLNLYDVAVDTYADLQTVGTTRVKQAKLSVNVVDGKVDTIDIIEPGFGYKVVPPIKIVGDGTSAKAVATIDNQGRVVSITVENSGKKYSTALATIRNFAVLVQTDSTANNFWSIYAWDDVRKSFFRNQSQAYDTTKYWSLVDWWKTGYSSTSRIVKEIDNIPQYATIDTELGDLIRVKETGSGGWAVFERITDTYVINQLINVDIEDFSTHYQLVGREKGTLEISSLFYNTGTTGIGYDNTQTFDTTIYDVENSLELRNILKAIKEDIFTGDYAVEWNNLFFISVRAAFAEQPYIDWAFKTSFLNAIHNVGAFEQKLNYRSDNLDSFQEYINEVKPYRTTVREYVSRYDTTENVGAATSDFDLQPTYSVVEGKVIPVIPGSVEAASAPWVNWTANHTYSVTEISVYNQGANYTQPPAVLIEGDGTGATAQAYISNGNVSGIKVLTSGSGYTYAPIITLRGGTANSSDSAKASAIIGDTKARTFDITVKFDRIAKFGLQTAFTQTETIIGDGITAVYELKHAPTRDKSKIGITKNNQLLLNSEYSISLYTSTVGTYSLLKGKLVLSELPELGDIIVISYEKNDDLLDSVNRVEKFYAPVSGMKGKGKTIVTKTVTFAAIDTTSLQLDSTFSLTTGMKLVIDGVVTASVVDVTSDFTVTVSRPQTISASSIITFNGYDFSQLMTGFDFGGVLVQGTTFEVTGGWDALPWFTDNWDSVESSADFYYVTDVKSNIDSNTLYKAGTVVEFGGSLYKAKLDNISDEGEAILPIESLGWEMYWELFTITLPFVPSVGQLINIYIKRVGTYQPGTIDNLQYSNTITEARTIRIDDPNWPASTNPNAMMPTFVGDGVNNIVELDQYNLDLVAGDTLIFRPIESDGSVTITDPNLLDTKLSGGSLSAMSGAYQTANGMAAEDIGIDGGKFISPEQVSATEENVPGQVLDSLSIKVYDTASSGTAPLQSRTIVSDGVTRYYNIGINVIESNSVIVYIDQVKQELGTGANNYVVDLINNQVEFIVAPPITSIIEIIAIGIGGTGILDRQSYIADGVIDIFQTTANYANTVRVFVTVNGIAKDIAFTENASGNTQIQITPIPAYRDTVNIVVLSAAAETDINGYSIVRVNQVQVYADGSSTSIQIPGFTEFTTGSSMSSMIVEVNGITLQGVDTTYQIYDGVTNQLEIGTDPYEFPGTILPDNLKVLVNNSPLVNLRDYVYSFTSKILTIEPTLLTAGDIIKVENDTRSQYSVSGDVLTFTEDIQSSITNNDDSTIKDEISLTWFSSYPEMNIVSDEFSGNQVQYQLSSTPLDVSYIWVYKNGARLVQDQDFYVSLPRAVVYLKNSTVETDKIKIVQFGSDISRATSAYEIHKDMLNVYHYNRYSIGAVALAKALTYYDQSIEVTDSSELFVPTASRNIPGAVEINGERIEYLQKVGNVLSQLRRGAKGTAIGELYAAGSTVTDVGPNETVPYKESQDRTDFVSDGSSRDIGVLEFVPTKSNKTRWITTTITTVPAAYGPCDEIEVFVGGRRLRKDPIAVYNEDDPATDTILEAEFSVDGTTEYIRLTDIVPAGTRISVIRRTGNTWYDRGLTTATTGKTLLENDNAIAKFIVQKTTTLPE